MRRVVAGFGGSFDEKSGFWSEAESKRMAETKYMLGGPARIGVVFLDGERSFVVKKAVKNVECFAGIGRDNFCVERRVAIGDVGIELDPWLRTIAGVVVGTRFTVSASPEELTI